MKKAEFLQCVKAATHITDISQAEKDSALDIFSGCYFSRERLLATARQFSYILNYQAMQFNGTWDNEELLKMAVVSRRVDLI